MNETPPVSNADNDLDVHVYTDLYHRSRVSVLAYFVLFWALVFLTPFFKEQRSLALIMGFSVTVVVAFRLYLALSFSPERFSANPDRSKRMFFILVVLSSLLWGGLMALVAAFFGVLSWAGLYCLIMSCGILAGGTNSLAPSKPVMVAFISVMLVPLCIWALMHGEFVLAILLTVFVVLLLSVAKESHIFYMSNLNTRMTIIRQSEELGNTMGVVSADSEKLKTSSESLSDMSSALKTSSEDMSSRIGDIETLSFSMRENAEIMSQSVERTTVNVEMVSEAIQNIVTSIDQASKNTNQVMDVTSQAVDQALKASEKIDILNHAALEIGKITEMINEISEQTNLLALNATIEAARAGDAGKGFAVVASEIKELAKQTAHATDKIKNEVLGIQTSTRESAEEVKDISQAISTVKEQVGSLADAVTEQGMMSEEIQREIKGMSENMMSISHQIDSNASLVNNMGEIIEKARHITDQVMALGTKSSENANGLRDMAKSLSQLTHAVNGVEK